MNQVPLYAGALLTALAIWASLESIRPLERDSKKDSSITPVVAAGLWLLDFVAVILLNSGA